MDADKDTNNKALYGEDRTSEQIIEAVSRSSGQGLARSQVTIAADEGTNNKSADYNCLH